MAITQRPVETPSARRRTRRRVPLPLAVPAALLVALVALLALSPAARARADDFLGLFRTGRREPLAIIDAQLPVLPGLDAALDDVFDVQLPPGQRVPLSHNAQDRVDFNVRTLRTMPEPPRVDVFVNEIARVTINRATLEKILAAAGGPLTAGFRLPPELDQPLQARIPAAVRQVWSPPGGELTLWLSRNPRFFTTTGPTWEEQRARLIQLAQFLAPDAARELQGVRDWDTTVVVPVPPNATTRRVRADGTDNALLVERDGRATLIWQRYGVVHLLDGHMPGRALIGLANGMR